MHTHRDFARPTGLLIPRVADKRGWLFLDRCRIQRDNYGVLATITRSDGTDVRVYLPVASLQAILIGPGTSITGPAIGAIIDSGCSISIVGSGATTYHSTITPRSTPTDLLLTQAVTVTDQTMRIAAARRLYQLRFDNPLPDDVTIEQLRGLEGVRMKTLYKSLAQLHHIPRFRRTYDPHNYENTDPINQALSTGNACLYATVLTVIHTLGLSPGLGVLHTGHPRAFAHDIADLYKHETTIPLAFALAKHHDAANEARRRLADQFRTLALAPRMVRDIHHVLTGQTDPAAPEHPAFEDIWAPSGNTPAGTQHGETA